MKGKNYIFIIIFLLLLLNINVVKADTAKVTSKNVGDYYHAHMESSSHFNRYGQILNTKISSGTSVGAQAYCIAPGEEMHRSKTYNVYNYSDGSILDIVNNAQEKPTNKLTLDELQKMQLYAHYGYGYGTHTTDVYIVATQMLIYRTIEDTVFVNGLCTDGCSKVNDPVAVTNAMNEIQALVDNHQVTPSFNGTSIKLKKGETQELEDTNNVLSLFSVDSCNNCTAQINGNKLSVTTENGGEVSVTLVKNGRGSYDHSVLFLTLADSQNLITNGNIDPVYANISGEAIEGYIEINKVDSENNSCEAQGDAKLVGAVYGIYNEDGEEVDTLTIGSNCKAKSKALEVGNYTVREKTPNVGYKIDTRTYNATIEEHDQVVSITSKEEVYKFDFHLFKVKSDGTTGEIETEPNAVFDVTLISKSKKVGTITTDDKGRAKITLPYGKYSVCQTKGAVDSEDARCFEIDIKNKDVDKVINNGPIKARIKVIKIDSVTKEELPIAGIKFKIKNLDTGEYVCQMVSYPTNEKLCVFKTNEEGILYTPYGLEVGHYQLEEIDQVIDGYLWNREPLKFEVKKDADFTYDDDLGVILEVKFANQEVLGKIVIHKTGEEFVIKDGSFTYEEIALKGIKFGLYDEKGKLIATAITNKDGYAEFTDLKLGKYILKEMETIDGYVLDTKEYELNLEYRDQYTPVVEQEITLKNYLKKGKIEITKVDISNDKPLPNTLIEVYTIDNELIFSGRTDKHGKVIIENLKTGKYYFLEKEAPEGYLINKDKMYFEIKEDGEIVKSEMKDVPITGNLEFTKTDLSTGEALPNTLIEIYTINDKLIFRGRTDENGKIFIKRLRYGRYYILEKEAPEGYVLNPEKMYFSIRRNGEIVKANMENKLITGTLEFTKTDLSTGEPLPNTLIEIYTDKDELIFSGRTDNEGKIIIEKLEYGRYYILEKEAPEGYILNPDRMYFEIKEDGEIVKATMTNEKVIIDVPITGLDKTYVIEIVTSILAIVGAGVIVYAIKKRKSK